MIYTHFSEKRQLSVDQLFVSIFDHSEIPYYEKTVIDNNSILAIDKNRVVGFLLLSHRPNEVHDYQVSYIAVDKEYRNRGIATKMLDMVNYNVWLEVLNSNTDAVAFYMKKNFKLYETFICSDASLASIFTRNGCASQRTSSEYP
jgi:ribosomal protein S18 acetylase RimI-like enzyme